MSVSFATKMAWKFKDLIEGARRAVGTVRDKGEHGTAAVLLGNALSTLGQRENGTERLPLDNHAVSLEIVLLCTL